MSVRLSPLSAALLLLRFLFHVKQIYNRRNMPNLTREQMIDKRARLAGLTARYTLPLCAELLELDARSCQALYDIAHELQPRLIARRRVKAMREDGRSLKTTTRSAMSL